jgi:hypothetical protein
MADQNATKVILSEADFSTTESVEDVEIQDDEQPEPQTTDKLTKEQVNENESRELFQRVIAGTIENIKDRVAYLLNYSSDTRNSDIELAFRYWEMFEDLQGVAVTKQDMLKLTKISSLSRVRAKIQNEYKLFEADPDVKRYRGKLEEDFKQGSIDDKPSGLGLYSVYIDESGKNDKIMSVGSLWLSSYGPSEIRRSYELRDWLKYQNIDQEFHFTEMGKSRLDLYKNFWTKFISLYPEAGFKFIIVNNKGISDKNKAITDLTYHLIADGVRHEHESGRATLPRMLSLLIDDEEDGSDRLKLANVKERIKGQQIDDLYLGEFQAVVSKTNYFIQIIDLFVGSVNRKLNTPDGSNHKDELANFILSSLNLDFTKIDKENDNTDKSKVFNLTSNLE